MVPSAFHNCASFGFADGVTQQVDGFIKFVEFAHGAGEIVERLDVAGTFRQEKTEELLRQVVQPHLVGEAAEIVGDGRVFRLELQRGFVTGDGAGEIVALIARDGEDMPGFGRFLVNVQSFQRAFATALPITLAEKLQRVFQQIKGIGALDVFGGAEQDFQGFG